MNFGFECFRKLICCIPKIYGWGHNWSGQLGLGEGSGYKSDMPLPGTEPPTIDKQSDWIKVCSGGSRGYGIRSNGTLWGWGGGWAPGDGVAENYSHPVQIGVGHQWIDVSASPSHTLAVREDGTLWAWGSNSQHALGTHLRYLRGTAIGHAEEAIRAVLSRPIAAAGQQQPGKYSKKPTAQVVQMKKDSLGSDWVVDDSISPTPAQVEAVMNYTVTSVELTSAGSGYTSTPTVTIDGDGSASVRPNMTFKIVSIRVTNGGSGYTSRPTVIAPWWFGSSTMEVSAMGSVVESVLVTNPGSGYIKPPSVTINGALTSSLAAVIVNGAVSRVDVAAGFKIDAESASIGFVGGGGSGATAQATLRMNHVVAVGVVSQGSFNRNDYFSSEWTTPVTFSGPGTGATASVAFGDGYVNSLTLTPGDGYRETPAIAFSGGGGDGASAEVVSTEGEVESVSIVSPGDGYTRSEVGFLRRCPFVQFTRDPEDEFQGPDASFICSIEPGPIQSLVVSDDWKPKPPPEPTPFAPQGTGRVPMGQWMDGRNCIMLGDRQETLPLTQDSLGWESAPFVISGNVPGGLIAGRAPFDGPSTPTPVWNLEFLSETGSGASGTISTASGWIDSATLTNSGDFYASEPIVEIDGVGNVFRRPIQVGLGKTWKSVSAGGNYSLAIDSSDLPYWWGTIPGLLKWPDSFQWPFYTYQEVIKRPARVGSRVYITAEPTSDEVGSQSILPLIYGDWIEPPASEGGIPAAIGNSFRQLKTPAYGGDGNGPAVPAKYEGPIYVTMSAGHGYTEVPEVLPRAGAGYTLTASLVGPGECQSVLAAGSSALAIDTSGVLWRLNATSAFHGDGFQKKDRLFLYESSTHPPAMSVQQGAEHDGRNWSPIYGDTMSPIRYRLEDGKSGNPHDAKGEWSPFVYKWYIVKRTETTTWVNGENRVANQDTIHSQGTVTDDYYYNYSIGLDVWAGSVVAPAEVSPMPSAFDANYFYLPMPGYPGAVEPLAWPVIPPHVQVPGQVTGVQVTNGGSGYTSPPTVSFSPGGASAYARIKNGQVIGIQVMGVGGWFDGAPAVTISGGGGSGATAEATIAPNPLPAREYFSWYRFGDTWPEFSGKSHATYEKLPPKLVHGGFGPAKVAEYLQWNKVASEKTSGCIGETTDGKLFFDVSTRDSFLTTSLTANPYPAAFQSPQLGIGGHSGVKESDQSLWLLGDPKYGPPVVKGDVELKIDNHGEGYTEPAILSFSSQAQGVATAKATLNGSIISVGVVQKGSGYRTPPTVSVPGNAQIEAAIAGPVESVQVTNGGSGYRVPPKVVFSQPGISATATSTIKDGAVQSVRVSEGGRYRASPTVSFEPVPDVESIAVTAGGSGYTSPPRVLVVGGSGSGCEAKCSIDGKVTGITITNGGSGYTSPPTVSFSGGGGSGASAIAGIDEATGKVSGVTVLNPGSGYQSPPTVVFTGGGGNAGGAAAVAAIAGPVRDVTVTSRGSGYYRPPQVFFQGSGGTGATATAATAAPGSGAAATSKINGSVIYCKVLNGGSGYRSSPQVTFTGGGNERISSLEAKLSAGEITQAEFDDSVSHFRATAQARIKGGVTLSVENGGEKYSHKAMASTIGPFLLKPGWGWNGPYGYAGSGTGGPPYWRDGDMMSTAFWVHSAGGSPRPTSVSTNTVNITNPAEEWVFVSEARHGRATPSTTERPGGAISSMSDPEGSPPSSVLTSTNWTQEPLVSFWNTRALGAVTRLRRCAIARRSDATPQPKSIYTWPHSMSHLESVLAMSDAETLLYGSTVASLLGFMRRLLFSWGGGWPAVAEFMSGGTIVSAYLDGVLSSPFPIYGDNPYIIDGGDRTPLIIQESAMQYKFASPPTVQVECDVGTGASVTVSADGSGTGTVNVGSGGSGYGSLARAVVSGGRPKITPAAATATLVNGAVTAVSVTASGEGYTSPPLVILHGGGGAGATAEAVMSDANLWPHWIIRRSVVGVKVTSGGSGYTSPPTVSFVETDKDYADFVIPRFSWAGVYGHSEPSGWKARLVGVENATPEYTELLGGDRDTWEEISEMTPSPTWAYNSGDTEVAEDLTCFYADGHIVSATIDESWPDMERHPANLKKLPDGATVVVRGNCDTTAAISVIRPKWSNELDGYGGVTFAVRDETP